MSRNVSRLTFTLVACLVGAAYSHGQNIAPGQPFQAQVAAPPAAGGIIAQGGGGNVFYAPAFPNPHDGDPEMQKLNQEERGLARQADELARRLGDAENTGDRDKLRTELREVLGKQFDLQRERREQEIAQIEERVRKLRDQLKKRSDNRQKIIDNRIDQILNDADGLGWNGPDGGGGFGGFNVFGGGGRAVTIPAPAPGPGARGIAPAPVPPGIPGTAPRPVRAPGGPGGAPDVPPVAR
jgi:flagellar motility protein MotE (MotC chaperone)